MKELPSPELIENRRRSVAMLTPGVPALSREEALELLQARCTKCADFAHSRNRRRAD